MSRFVRPDQTCTLALSGGDTITVRRRLTAGEQHDAYATVYALIDDKLVAHPAKIPFAMIVAYLLDWTLTDDNGVVVPIRGLDPTERLDVIRALDSDTVAELREVINRHEATQRRIRDQEKKLPGGVNGAAVISPSPFDAAGASSGSATSTPTTTPYS